MSKFLDDNKEYENERYAALTIRNCPLCGPGSSLETIIDLVDNVAI